jgi:hypothetical protein
MPDFLRNRNRRLVRSVTAEFCGDPAPDRSALGGWKQRGEGFLDAGHFDSKRGVRRRVGKAAEEGGE